VGAPAWDTLAPGLALARFTSPQADSAHQGDIRILRIDPRRCALTLLCASATPSKELLTPRQWCERNGLAAAINPSMYQQDYLSSVSLMVADGHVNNARVSSDKCILAFDPLADTAPPVRLIDRECDNFPALRPLYNTLIQSIRMRSCRGRNVWAQQPRRWPTAATGIDSSGNVLFIHVGTPYSTHDVIELLSSLPIGLARCMYGDGGSPAQLFVQVGAVAHEWHGTAETGVSGDTEWRPEPLPNVLGVSVDAP